MASNSEFWIIVIQNIDKINFYFSAGDFKILVFAGEFVGALAVNFDGGKPGWSLGDNASKVLECRFDIF